MLSSFATVFHRQNNFAFADEGGNFIAKHFITQYYIAKHFITQYFITQYFITQYFIAKHYIPNISLKFARIFAATSGLFMV